MNGILFAFFGTMATFSVTAVGSAAVFFVKREVGGGLQRGFLGFAGGVMVAASVWSLLLPGLEFAKQNGQIGWLIVPGGFLLGVIMLLIADFFVNKRIQKERRSTLMLVTAITVHNIPEGMAVGLAFALAGRCMQDPAKLSGAIALTIGIAIQNFPEGTAVALPLIKEGMQKRKAFFIASMTAAVEPVSGMVAAVFADMTQSWIAVYLAFAAGTMIYVVVEELIPEAHVGEEGKEGTLGFVVGFLVMMILDVALG